ncbi:PepSY domain-containing protein [Terriglobus albidus]|uniref:PepSY domain-containing protein n=1 Tax=Terriglobus albidus TaxID=1592106 RepID=UPI0021E0021E|nr:PepSY domain-containing protein [Terriglobus albidus]
MTRSHLIVKASRAIHLYMGVFLTPAILFFAVTGAWQTFSLQSASKDGSYVPSRWVQQFSQLHKNQTFTVPPPKKKSVESSENKRAEDGRDKTAKKMETIRSPLPMKIFFMLVSIGLLISTLTGLYMSYRYARNKVVVSGALVAGVVVPLLLELL